jgi:hypothetical protein
MASTASKNRALDAVAKPGVYVEDLASWLTE